MINFFKKQILKFKKVKSFAENLNNEYARDKWVQLQLGKLKENSIILDAGAGAQRYRKYCNLLNYKAQDFCEYVQDEKPSLCNKVGDGGGYIYGQVDYVGNIWSIQENDRFFDAILCTEVFEHIAYPNDAIAEFSRLLKGGGRLILTAPSNCMRHMDPYYYYSGFSDRYYEEVLSKNGFKILSIEAVGDYWRWISVEIYRTIKIKGFVAFFLLLPAFLYFHLQRKTESSVNTLCMGYHVIAERVYE